ncbi:MAG: DNA replication/repair protein RecF [Fidelibacterota bacterium]
MSIQEVELISFRNHQHTTVEFKPGLNVIWGENGSGKTSILEAIYSLSLGRSFKTPRRQNLITRGRDYYRVTGRFTSGQQETTITTTQMADGRSKTNVNGETISGRKKLIGLNPVVLLSPEEQLVTKGSPGERRKFFDKLFSVASSEYMNTLTEFLRIRKQRDAALMAIRDHQTSRQTLEPWNEPYIDIAWNLWEQRAVRWQRFETVLVEVMEKLNDATVTLSGQHQTAQPADREAFRKDIKESLQRDIALGRTNRGPQRDNFTFYFNGDDLRTFGSQGEHKLALILLKLAEFKFLQLGGQATPIILLDDVLAKLDFERSEIVMSMLEKKVQTIITTTNVVNVESHGIDMKNPDNMALYFKR